MAQFNVNLAFNADTGKAKAQIQELQSLLSKIAYTGTTSPTKGLQTDLQAASAVAKELQFHLNNAFNASTGNFDLSMLDRSLKTSGSNVTDLSMKLLNAGTTGQQAFVKLAQSISLADQPMFRISKRMQEFAVTMKNTVKWQLSSSMLHGFMGAVQSAYGYAQDLNKSLNDIRIVTGYNTDKMAEFAEQANKAAKALSTTTTDYTNASLIYFQQGLSDEEVTARTDITVKMANAVGQSAEVISEQLTAVWNNFDDGSKSLEYYADVMTALGAATASSSDEISEGLSKFAAVAGSVGLSYEYATSALATLTSNTRESADVVGNSLKTLFARIQGLQLGETLDDGTDLNKYSQALEKVGISIYDANGGLKDMDNILDEMATKWNALSDTQQVALAQTVAGVRQYNQLIALMENWNNGDSDSMVANLNTVAGSEGALQKQADIYAQSWEAAEKRVQAAAEGIFQSLLDDKFFISLNNGFANLLNGIDAFIDKAGGIKTILVGVAGIIISTFANKIPSALDTLKYNLQVLTKGSQEAYKTIQEQMTEATKLAFEKGKIQKDSSMGYAIEQANKLTLARNQLALVSDKMSAAEKQAAEVELSLIERTQQEVIALKEKNEELQKSISLSLTEIGEPDSDYGYQRGSSTVKKLSTYNNADYQLGIDTGLNTMEQSAITTGQIIRSSIVKALTDAEVATKGLSDSFKPIDINLIKIQGTLTPLGQQMIEISKSLTDFSQTDLNDNQFAELRGQAESFLEILPSGVRNLKQVRQAINDVSSAKDINTLNTKFQDLITILQKVTINSKNAGKALEGSADSKTIQKLIKDMKNLGDNTENTKNKVATLEQLFSKFNPGHTIRMSEALSSLSGMATNVVFALRNVISALDALSNPNLSGWEKFSSILFSISTLAPSILSFSRDFATVKNFVAQATEKAVIALTNENNLQKLLINTETKRSGIYGSYAAGKVVMSEAIVQGLNEEQQKSISLLMTEAALAQAKNELNDQRKKELIAAVASTIAKDKEATESEEVAAAAIIEAALKKQVTKVTWQQVAAQMGLNTAMLPYIAALVAIAAIIGGVVAYQKKQAEITRENAETAREAATASREQTNSNQKLVDSYLETLNTYNEVKEAFDSGKATSEQLADAQNSLADSAIEVAKALGIEGAALAKLSGDYSDLTDKIIEVQRTAIQDAINKEEKAKSQTGEEFITDLRDGKGRFTVESGYFARMGSGMDTSDEKFFQNVDYSNYEHLWQSAGEVRIDVKDQSVESLMAAYEEAQDLYNQALSTMTAAEMNKSEVFQNLKNWLEKSSESYEAYKAAEDNIQNYKVKSASLTEFDGIENAYDISSIEEYDKYASAMIENIAKSQDISQGTEEWDELTEAVHAYLGALEGVSDFATQSKAFDEIAKKTGIARDELIKYYNELTPEEQKLFFSIAFNSVDNIAELDKEIELLQAVAAGQAIQVKLDVVSEGLELLDDDATTEEIVAWAKKMQEVYGEAFNLEEFLAKSSNEQLNYLQNLKKQEEQNKIGNRDIQIDEYKKARQDAQNELIAQESEWNRANDENIQYQKNLSRYQDIKTAYNKAISEGQSYDFSGSGFENIDALNNAINATEDLIAGNDNTINSYKELEAQIKNYDQAISDLEIEKQIENAYGWRDALQEESEALDISYDEVQDYATQLRENHKILEDNIELSEEIALAEKKQSKGADDLIDNYKDYKKVLKEANLKPIIKDTESYIKTIKVLKKDLSLLTGFSEEIFSEDFVNSDAVQQALEDISNGIDGATERLKALAAIEELKITGKVELDGESLNQLYLDLAEINNQDVEIGAVINDAPALDTLADLLNSTNMTAAQMQEIFNNLGWEPEIVYEKVDATTASALRSQGYQQYATLNPDGGYTLHSVPLHGEQGMISDQQLYVPKIKSKNHGGGSYKKIDPPGNSSTKSPSSSGGGGSKSKKETKQRDDEVERYHVVKEQMEELEKQAEKLSKAKDQAFGKGKLDLIEKEIELLDEEIKKQDEYLEQIQKYGEEDKALMIVYGAEFDENGVITNYEQLMDQELAKYNAAVEAYNKNHDEKKFAAAEARYEKFLSDMEQYEETMDEWDEAQAARADKIRKNYDLRFEALTYEIEVGIELEEDDLKLLDYYLEKLDDDAFSAAESITLLGKKTQDLLDQSKIYSDGITDLLSLHGLSDERINQYMNGSLTEQELITIGFSDEDIATLREYRDNLLEINKDLSNIREEIYAKIIDAFDAWNEKIIDSIDKIEKLNKVLNSYQNIIDIVGMDTLKIDDKFMNNLSNAIVDNSKKVLDASVKKYKSLQNAQLQAQQQYEQSLIEGNEETIRYWEETLEHINNEVQNAEQDMMDSWQNALQAAADAFDKSIENIINSFEKALSGSFGNLDNLSEMFEQQTEISDRYLADYEKIYQLSKLNRDINNSIDDTDSIKAKRILKSLQEDINDLQNSEKEMSQYDLEYLQKKYELKLAEIALEEAQNAKSTVRLMQDSEGNWSYVYTNDQEKISDAQQRYEDALFDMQVANEDYIQDLQEKALDAQKAMTEAIKSIDKTQFATEDAYKERIDQIREYYMDQQNYYYDEMAKALGNNKELYENDWLNYSNLTNYKISSDKEYVDNFAETTYAQIMGYSTIEEAQNNFIMATDIMVEEIIESYTLWLSNINEIMDLAGTSIDTFASDTENNLDRINTKTNEVADSIDDLSQEIVDDFDYIIDTVSDWEDNYVNAIDTTIQANEDMYDSCNSLIGMLNNVDISISNTGKNFSSTAQQIAKAAADIAAAAERAANAAQNIGSGSTLSGGNVPTDVPPKTSQTTTAPSASALKIPLYASPGGGYKLDVWVNKSTIKKLDDPYPNLTYGYFLDQYSGEDGYITKSDYEKLKKRFFPGSGSGGVVGGLASDKVMVKMDTGGYTGDWGPDGKIAMLHQKELVLNAEDTQNMLNAVNMVREIARVIDLNAGIQSLGLYLQNLSHLSSGIGNSGVQQSIQITAEFPDAVYHSEIEEAFKTLLNESSQYIGREK